MMPVVTGEQLDLLSSKKATIGKRSKAEAAFTDQTCTPRSITELLPMVDLDPCSNERSTVKARRTYRLDRGQDGLLLPWHGTVFDNNPFSDPLPWMLKAIIEMSSGRCTDLIVLAKQDESTEWWGTITSVDDSATAPAIRREHPEKWAFLKRVQYDEHPDMIEQRRLKRIEKALKEGKPIEGITGESSNNFCSVILHHRGWDRRGGRLVRKPKLNLESVARRWIVAIGVD